LKYELLDKWLPLSSTSQVLDDTMAEFNLDLGGTGDNSCSGQESSADEVNLLRCVYVLQSGFDKGLEYLLKYAFTSDPMVSTSHQLRALQCLFSTCQEEELENATGKPVEELNNHLRKLIFLNRLEDLGLQYSPSSLDNIPSLVEGVWRSCKHSKEGVMLVTDLCLEYEVWGTKMWSAILHQIIQFSMQPTLRSTLRALNSQPHLWNLANFTKAWNTVLLTPLLTLIPPLAPEKKKEVKEGLELLQLCPTASDLDLGLLSQECLRLDLTEVADILLPYLRAAHHDHSNLEGIKMEQGNIKLEGLQVKQEVNQEASGAL